MIHFSVLQFQNDTFCSRAVNRMIYSQVLHCIEQKDLYCTIAMNRSIYSAVLQWTGGSINAVLQLNKQSHSAIFKLIEGSILKYVNRRIHSAVLQLTEGCIQQCLTHLSITLSRKVKWCYTRLFVTTMIRDSEKGMAFTSRGLQTRLTTRLQNTSFY